MRKAEPQLRSRKGGSTEPKRFNEEAAGLRADPGEWYDLEVPETKRRLYDLIYNLRNGRYSALPPREFEFTISDGALFARLVTPSAR